MNANTSVSIPMLIAWPTVRMVATAADATDVSFGGTELMMKFIEVSPFKKEKRNSEIVPRAIPRAANICGTNLSDSLPAIGARTTWHNGATSRIIPAVCESNPLMYCR